MTLELILVLVVMVVGFISLYWVLRQQLAQAYGQSQLENVVNQIFGLSANKLAEQSKQLLASEKDAIRVDLENKQKALEKLFSVVQEDLKTRQQEIRALEQDRNKKFGELTSALDQHRQLTDELKVSTQQLASVLSNNQTRGGWGERIIEDLLQANGLVENIHYLKQSKQTSGNLRPDITLLLPNQRNVPVDVKFPYAEIQKMAQADTKTAKEGHLKQFALDLRSKINKVAEYINPEEQTLDYAILFVPNEMVFSFINQKFPDIVDEAIGKRVMIVSPFTFLIVARTVMESYRNFMIGDRLKAVVHTIGEFTSEWQHFRDEFEKFGRSIESLRAGYEKLTTTRTTQLQRKIDKISRYEQGSLLSGEKKEVSD